MTHFVNPLAKGFDPQRDALGMKISVEENEVKVAFQIINRSPLVMLTALGVTHPQGLKHEGQRTDI